MAKAPVSAGVHHKSTPTRAEHGDITGLAQAAAVTPKCPPSGAGLNKTINHNGQRDLARITVLSGKMRGVVSEEG